MDRTGALLRRLGDGESIGSVCDSEGWQRTAFDEWWAATCRERLAQLEGILTAPLSSGTRIERDGRGIPHVIGSTDRDIFVGYGFAIGQDRLFQLEMQRRKGHGTLAAFLGPAGIEADRIAHTIGFPALVARETAALDDETRALHAAYADGITLAIAAFGERLPIEFGLLGMTPDTWDVADTIACVTAWRWQFTGRPHVVAGPELLRRALGDETLVATVLAATRECDESILPPDAVWPPAPGDAPWRDSAVGTLRRPGRRDRQQRLGHRGFPQPIGQAAAGLRPAHALPVVLGVLRGRAPRRLVRCRGCRDGGCAGPPVRA